MPLIDQRIQAAIEHVVVALRWLGLIIPLAAIVGTVCAFILWSVGQVGLIRLHHPWLLYLLPIGGFGLGLLFHFYDRSAEERSNLITDQIHVPGGGIPRRVAPLVLCGTLVTHLFGGSAGREGIAMQLGGSIASAFCQCFRPQPGELRVLLTAGIAAGFGAVFGAPVAGAFFALEVLSIGRVEFEALLPTLIASVAGYWVCHAWGINHTLYTIHPLDESTSSGTLIQLNLWLLLKVSIASIAFGIAGPIFAAFTHGLSATFRRLMPFGPIRPLVGGAFIIGLYLLVGTPDYLGLGISSPDPKAVTIISLFRSSQVHHWDWFWKMVFTALTLSAGFKGGEVTPLFFIGAALGNVLASSLGAPADLFAALGLVAVFAGATKTPLACAVMGVELFGAAYVTYIAIACFFAHLFSGRSESLNRYQ